MTTSKSRTTANKITSAAEWKRKSADNRITLPSGNTVRAKRPGIKKLLASGVFPDVFMPIIQDAIRRGTGAPPPDIEKVVGKNPDVVFQLMDTMDRITAQCVIEPAVEYHRREIQVIDTSPAHDHAVEWEDIPDDDRDPDAVYTDEIDEEDKQFIFNWVVGGTADLERFRRETNEYMGSVHVKSIDGNSSV
jgi:hypothetical protein